MERPGLTHTDELVRRAIIGDGTAFTELWDTNIDALKAYLKGSMKQLDEFYIDDVCSRSFEKAFRQIQTFDPSKSRFSTWLKVIAHNTALDVIDSEKRDHNKLVWLDDRAAAEDVIDTIGDGNSSALEVIIKDEDEQTLEKLIEALPQLYREIARKRLIEGLQYKEIAEELEMELNTVRTRIRRAKALLDDMKTTD